MKKALTFIFRIGISIALLIFLISRVGKTTLLETLHKADPILLFAAFFLYLGTYALACYRWEMLLRGADVHIARKRIISSYASGLFFSLFTPSSIGGDFARSVDLTRHTNKPKEIIASVFLDRLSGYIGLIILVAVALPFGLSLHLDKSIYITVGVLTVLLIAMLAAVFNGFLYRKTKELLNAPFESKIKEVLLGLHHEVFVFRGKPGIIVKNILCSIVLQGIQFVATYIIARSLGIEIKSVYFFIFVPVISAITMLPISIGGLGVRDAATIMLFSKVGVTKDMAFAMSIAVDFIVFAIGIIGGLIYVSTLRNRWVQRD